MLYEEYETETSHNNLSKVVSAVPAPACLIGGWAVYYTVNADYKAKTGTSYQGSKDIDLGFHIDKDATVELLRETDLAKASRSLEEMGFRGMGVRLFREYHRETRLPLSEAKAKKIPSYNLFQLYVDLLVDNAPAGIKKAVGFTPFDEKLLDHVFRGRMYKSIDEFPAKVIIPTPQVLLAMKMNSLPGRTKDHKKHKDVMDVYALIWHSGVPVQKLYSDVSRLISRDAMLRTVSAISSSDYIQTASFLEMDPKRLETAITGFVNIGRVARQVGEWPLPRNMSYNKLVLISKALLQKEADKMPVTLNALSGIVGLGNQTTRRGLSFLDSVGIVSRQSKGLYVLTADGVLYAKAHSDNDVMRIRSLTLELINRSHLTDLADAIAVNKTITQNELYRRIKAFGRYPDGKGTGNMHAPDAVGARAVLQLFEVAGLIGNSEPGQAPDDAAGAVPKAQPGGRPDSTTAAARGRRRRSGNANNLGGRATTPATVQERTAGNAGERARPNKESPPPGIGEMGDLAVLTLKGVGEVRVNDPETLGLAEMYMDMLRKRVAAGRDA